MEEQPGTWLLDTFRRGGVDTARLREQLPAETERMLRHPERLWPEEVNQILVACEGLSGDPHFGLHLVDAIDITAYGTYGYLLLAAPTVRSFLEIARRYYPTFYRGAELVLTESGAGGALSYRTHRQGPTSPRHDNEWTLGFFVSFLQSRLDVPWYPTRVRFANSPPADLSELLRRFGPDLLFEQPETAFEFESDLFEVRISDADPRLLSILTTHADELLREASESGSLEAQIRLQILEQLGHGLPSAQSIARLHSMSLSAFKRRLGREEMNFRELRDEVVREVAQRLLRDTDIGIGAIALQVGYSEHSAFDRAFVRLTGMTPTEYRRTSSPT